MCAHSPTCESSRRKKSPPCERAGCIVPLLEALAWLSGSCVSASLLCTAPFRLVLWHAPAPRCSAAELPGSCVGSLPMLLAEVSFGSELAAAELLLAFWALVLVPDDAPGARDLLWAFPGRSTG